MRVSDTFRDEIKPLQQIAEENPLSCLGAASSFGFKGVRKMMGAMMTEITTETSVENASARSLQLDP
jgi:hypothetical protein